MLTTHTLSAAAGPANARSPRHCAEVSSHTELCSWLIEENLNLKDSCGPLIPSGGWTPQEQKGEKEEEAKDDDEDLLTESGETEKELEEVEVEEEVQVTVLQQSQERRDEEQVMKEDERKEGEEEEERQGEQTHTDKEAYSRLNANSEDSYSEITENKHSEDSYTENTVNKHPEDSYCENHTLQTLSEEPNTPAMDPDSLCTEPEDSEDRQEEEDDEEEEEKEGEEAEDEGGTTAELQTKGLGSLAAGPSPTEPDQSAAAPQPDQSAAAPQPDQSAAAPQPDQSAAATVPVLSSFYRVLLTSGALCLPGTRDRGGRALLTVFTGNAVWADPDFDAAALLRLLLYYSSTLWKEVAVSGLTVLVDARRASPVPVLFSALRALQENKPGSIHTVLMLLSKDSVSLRPDKPAAPQVEVLSSLKSVQKHVDVQQLPAEFGGSFRFSQSSWLCFRSRVEQLTNQCEDVITLLQKTIHILQTTPLPAAAEDAERLMSRYEAVMRSVLEDSRLVQLQQEGGLRCHGYGERRAASAARRATRRPWRRLPSGTTAWTSCCTAW
ncbi:rho guanine nucleotide exchange factor 40-like [Perca flavescens]|uniref:rho guanine nucleotide exchange factor 40-like n=1 Tax=Perca flavescens TaxID=8167 RepID=UPI00106E7B7E|nr:rho guanine nucleotide exchange factor 40-like [Perca flavescens]